VLVGNETSPNETMGSLQDIFSVRKTSLRVGRGSRYTCDVEVCPSALKPLVK